MKTFLAVLVFLSIFYSEDCYLIWREWLQLNNKIVCFESKNNKPGSFRPRFEGFLAAVKLVHRNGSIACGSPFKPHNSNWGAHNWPSLQNTPLNVLVTDENNDILFPKAKASFTGPHKDGKWYGLSGFHSRSKYLVLQHSFSTPHSLGPQSELRVWYGEDLLNYYESDNTGRVCVDVYGYFV